MAFDGITTAAVAEEIRRRALSGRVYKIAQPERDELLLTIKTNNGGTERLLLSVSASLPFVCFTERTKKSPAACPNFCMLLRKHIQNGRITSITQPGLERVIRIGIEHLNEMGDLKESFLIAELMGKHSNLIFVDSEDNIIDSIKHISEAVSSVRTVLPGRPYFIPETKGKKDPFSVSDENDLMALLKSYPGSVFKALYENLTGISSSEAVSLCIEAGLDPDLPALSSDEDKLLKLCRVFRGLLTDIREGNFSPELIYDKKRDPADFAAVHLSQYEGYEVRPVDSVSEAIERFYSERSISDRMRQRSADTRKVVSTIIERDSRKLDIQLKQLESTKKKDRYRIYGELLNTYGYSASEGDRELKCTDYYSGNEVTIPLDPDKTALENAQRYFDRYQKLKRTEEAVTELIKSTREELDHLLSIQASLDMIENEEDLKEIRKELSDSGYIRGKGIDKGNKNKISGAPLHYISSDGFDLYVGKNNYQNDLLTFKMATGNDWWFHSKKFPGSHVILKTGKLKTEEIPDRAFNEAGALAAYYSKGRDQVKVDIDYVQKKEIKKPQGAKPGFVVYYTNYSMSISPDISSLTLS